MRCMDHLGETGLFEEITPLMTLIPPILPPKLAQTILYVPMARPMGCPYVITNCSNNYGQQQFPEKLIPLFINNILNGTRRCLFMEMVITLEIGYTL